ncbi:MAG TPA: ABC transporter ATP-binding protein [Methylomirabilota bacterium]|jgi:iron(III) transport system ATP-binding protein|nr:ABC transporter ATP-binding protein [Methylomirabilota bacterium]
MIVTIQGVVKRFGAVTAVDAVDLTVADGELFTLLGPSGCGKTTLLRLLAGFYQPDAGTIRFGDRVVNGLAPYERRIGMVFQNYALWPHMTVADNIGYGLRLQRLPHEAVAERLREGLRKVNLVGFEARYPGQLSGGQQQRVALARALVLNPDILLLDEPLSNLDAKIRVQVRAEIRRLQRELAITTIYVTHDQEEALSLSDRVAVMRDGRVLQVGPPRDLYERPRTRFVADFVGTNNLVPGEVESRAAGGTDVVVRTALGPLRAIASGAVSARCVLAVRPENVVLGSAAAGEGNRVTGRVSLVSYLGSTVRYDVETEAGFVLKADIRDAWHHDPLPVGRPVTLHFPSSVTLAVSDDA